MSEAGRSKPFIGAVLLILALISTACGGGGGQKQEDQGGESKEGGTDRASNSIVIEGSSVVQPITRAAAEMFDQENPDLQISVGESDTSEGFEALCNGEAQISGASRPIEDDEIQACQENGIEFIELPVALNSLSVVVNPQNDFANDITLDELEMLWELSAEDRVTTWNQVRAEWPARPINLYGASSESDAFEFFTERVVGRAKESRSDYQASEDYNALVQGVASDPNALGYFGFGYFERNQDHLEDLLVDGVEPTAKAVRSGEYPLSRPLFIYVNRQDLDQQPALQEFVSFYMDNLDLFVEKARYVPLNDQAAAGARQRLDNRITGAASQDTLGQEKG